MDTAFSTSFLTLMVTVFSVFWNCFLLNLEMMLRLSSSTKGHFIGLKHTKRPENIIPIFQPPHSPELNPIERFWEFLKSKLEWENCKTLNHLRQKLAQVLETITPEQIASITSYDFILEALFSAAS